MTTEKLAFLQNFYTNVTLYVPPEPEAPLAASVIEETPGNQTVEADTASLSTAPAPPLAAPAEVPAVAAQKAAAPVAEPQTIDSENPVPTISEPVLPPTPPVTPAMSTPVTFSTLGSNAQGIVLLVRLPDDQFIKLPRNVFLNKMLQAIGFVMADVVLINVESDYPVALASLRTEVAATHVIGFGRNLLDVTMRNTQIYEPVQFPSLGLSYLASATVESVEYDVSLKKRLWPGLQRMFLS